jgi:hypothetical protein
MVRRDPKPAVSQDVPPYYIAEQPLYIGGQFGRAHNPGDRVPPEHVERYDWAALVRPPDGYNAPPAPNQPTSEPETSASSGQATTSSEGKDA